MPLDLARLSPDKRAHVEANARWAQIYPWGEVDHPKGPFSVDAKFFNALSEFLEDHRGIYFTPFAANHDSPGPSAEGLPDDARNKGRVIDLRAGAAGIEALIYFGKGLAKQFDEGLIDSLSPSHYTHPITSPATGKTYPTGLREVSSVIVRHLKNMPGASPWYQLEEPEQLAEPLTIMEVRMSGAKEEKKALTMEEVNGAIEAKFKGVEAQLTQLSEQIKKAAPVATQNTETPPPAADARVGELEKQIAQLKRENALTEAKAKLARSLALEDAAITTLAESIVASGDKGPQVLEQILKIHASAPAVTSSAEIGAPGSPARSAAGVTWEMAMEEAVGAGAARHSNRAINWIIAKYPHLAR